MNPLRDRAKEHFPTVLLTLLSIVQALSLELWWQYLSETRPVFRFELEALTLWAQIVTTIIGIAIVWVFYAGIVMRFRWVPATSDSLFPFFAGIVQFLLIDSLYSDSRGYWLCAMAVVFIGMMAILQLTMRRARRDPANALFFDKVRPASQRDFIAPGLLVLTLFVCSYLVNAYDMGGLAMLATIFALVSLLFQLRGSARYWNESMRAEEQADDKPPEPAVDPATEQ